MMMCSLLAVLYARSGFFVPRLGCTSLAGINGATLDLSGPDTYCQTCSSVLTASMELSAMAVFSLMLFLK
jgi:hypothetical protein